MRLGLRTRLAAFLLLTLLPLIALVFAMVIQERTQRIEQARHNTFLLAERGAIQQNEIVQQARSSLQMLTLIPEVRKAIPGQCPEILRRITALYPWSAGFSVAAPDGRLLCSSSTAAIASIADRDYFQRALATGSFASSGFMIGRVSGQPRMAVALPALNGAGAVEAVLVTGVDLKWLSGLSAEVAEASGGVVTIFDSQGTVLARKPDPGALTGRSLSGHPIVDHILRETAGVIEGPGLDGIPRIIGFAALTGADARIAVGISRDETVADVDRKLLLSTGIMILAVFMIVIGMWFLMDVLILRQLRGLQESAERLSSGRFDPQGLSLSAAAAPSREIGDVTRAIHAMGRTLQSIAFKDPLTGLVNRRFLDDHMAGLAAASPRKGGAAGAVPYAVLYMDLDGFKPINDRHGHAVGDAVLAEVGGRLMRTIRDGDIAARLGGDEFVVLVLMPPGTEPAGATGLAARIIEDMAAAFTIGGLELRIGCSIGIALWPTDHDDPAQVLLYADQALYAAKNAGRGRAVLWREGLPV